MIWLYVEDSYYYKNIHVLENYIEKINPNLDTTNKHFVFTKKELEKVLFEKKFNGVIVSPHPPAYFGQSTPFFGVIKIPNKFGLLTSSEKEAF